MLLLGFGVLAAMFSDHDLKLLDDLGYLSPRDHDLLKQAARPVGGTGTATNKTNNPQVRKLRP